MKKLLASFLLVFGVAALVAAPDVGPSPGVRYATDAYPGFDNEDQIVRPSKKEPRFFHWWNGPKKDNPADQLAWSRECLAEGSVRKARKGFDALVREWPTSPEAPVAQRELADLEFTSGEDCEEAYNEYRYLLDFYSTYIDYREVLGKMREAADRMHEEGKTIIFFRFRNTTDVRRAYEGVVLRGPGESFVPSMLLTIAGLREDEERYPEAIQVYENLRNLYPRAPESKTAVYREARARMGVLREMEYNRQRCQDTVDYLKISLELNRSLAGREEMEAWLVEANALVEDDIWRAAKFYDSRTRTRRSAINAYERFLNDYPASEYAPEARRRIAELENVTEVAK